MDPPSTWKSIALIGLWAIVVFISCVLFNLNMERILLPEWATVVLQYQIFGLFPGLMGLAWKSVVCLLILLPAVLLGKEVAQYGFKLWNSLIAFKKPLIHHYIVGLATALPSSVLWWNPHSFQTAFAFPGDFLVAGMVIVLCFFIRERRRSVCDIGFPESVRGASPSQMVLTADGDMVGFGDVVQDLFEQCLSLDDGHPSVCVGLIGDYGSGKTSLMHLLASQVRAHRIENPDGVPGRLRMIYFDVSKYSSASVLYVQLYNNILSILQQEYVLPLQTNYALVEAVTEAAGKASWVRFIDAIVPRVNPDDFHKHITGILSGTRIRLIILLDDIDRLMPHEMDNVIRLVRLLRTTRNIFVIMATDPDQLSSYQSLVAKERDS